MSDLVITNEQLRERAKKILTDFENAGASWEGVALALAQSDLIFDTLANASGLADLSLKVDTSAIKWDGNYCASRADIYGEENAE